MTQERMNQYLEALNCLEKAGKIAQETIVKYPNKLEKELNYIAWSVISDWYDSYEPHAYRRREDLFNVYRILVTEDYLQISFDSSYFEHWHHQDSEIIYNNVFKAGYHGGSKSDTIPENNNIPHWRKPHPYFTEWGEPAIQSFSPFYTMKELMEKKIKDIDEERSDDLEKVNRLMRKALRAIGG